VQAVVELLLRGRQTIGTHPLSLRRSYVSGNTACPSYLRITRPPKESDQRRQGYPETHADRNQLDNIDGANGRKAGIPEDPSDANESEQQGKPKREQFAPVAHD
jgi:hypothetical protein